ncbi:MAG TPA: HDOD domain-containing protein [Phycisphaerae bacterium]|nr:HDOD domain-containing protein [Phycisphaerae bacterium]
MMTVDILNSEIAVLAPMPASLLRLAAVIGDPDSNLTDVVAVIELDQALTSNVLRLANSAWSASARRIETVRDAVLRLGSGRVFELAVGERVAGEMSRTCPAYDLGEHELWRHSVAAALAAERLNLFTAKPVPAVGFTAALLHDVGKLVLGRHVETSTFERIREAAGQPDVTYLEAERLILGTDHAEVGGAVARHWRFPEELALSIERHHDPDSDPGPVPDAVHIANVVAKINGIGLGSEQMNMKASVAAAVRLGLSSSNLESLCATVHGELARTEELWGIMAHGPECTDR